MENFLHPEYKKREGHNQYFDIPTHLIYQPYVYELAKYFAERCNAKWIIDIGCGSGEKLISLSKKHKVIGIDCVTSLEFFKRNLPEAKLIQCNFEDDFPHINESILQSAVVICSDVIEHLQKPAALATTLARISAVAPFVLISTPDRCRARGWLDDGPPANPAHVMEWSGTEFVHFLRHCGFKNLNFFGHTINTQLHCAKTTMLVVAGAHTALPNQVKSKVKVAAIIHTYNELDILPEIIDYLVSQNVEIHVFDNWSDDGSWELLSECMLSNKIKLLERFPKQQATENYEWHAQLEKTAVYATTLDSDWIMHYDADEIRTGPWQGYGLIESISQVDFLGYNAIDFTVVDFRFLVERNDLTHSYESMINHFEFGRRPGHFKQIKCWKNIAHVNLADSGGHEAVFENRKVFPIKFLLKHYSLRNSKQAEKKVFKERLPRFKLEQQLYGWHNHYNKFEEKNSIDGWLKSQLIPWHSIYFFNEYIVERISGIGLKD